MKSAKCTSACAERGAAAKRAVKQPMRLAFLAIAKSTENIAYCTDNELDGENANGDWSIPALASFISLMGIALVTVGIAGLPLMSVG